MTGTELQTLNTEIRGGRQMDETTFYTLANLVKAEIERSRAWRKLITKDSSNTVNSSTSYATQFTVPSGFLLTLPRKNMKLIDSSGYERGELTEVKWEDWDSYKTSSGYYTIDHKNSKFYVSGIAGSYSQTYTLHLFYIGSSTTIAAATEWVFPSEFHPAIAFQVAAMDELGMDYDDINARQGNANYVVAQRILKSAILWDNTLQLAALGA